MIRRLILNSTKLLTGSLVRAFIQAAYFLILGTKLPPSDFGIFIVILSVAALAMSLDGFGIGTYYLMKKTRGNILEKDIGKYFISFLIINIILLLISLVICLSIYSEISLAIILPILISEIVFYSLSGFIYQHLQAIEEFKDIAISQVVFSIMRLGAVLALFTSDSMNIENWALAYFLSSFFAFLFALYCFSKTTKISDINFCFATLEIYEIKESAHFALSRLSAAIGTEGDKLIVSKVITLEATGIYGLTQRMINMLNMPLLAVFNVAFPKLVEFGESSKAKTIDFAKKIALGTCCYSLLVVILYFCSRGLIESIIGSQFNEHLNLIDILIFIPLSRSFKTIFADLLTGFDLQKTRSLCQFGMLPIGFLGMLFMSFQFGVIGAGVAAVGFELLSGLLFFYVFKSRVINEKTINS